MIQELRLTLFRNYSQAQIRFASGLNFLVGENGSGKTSLLEALYVASYLKSFRVSGPHSFLTLSNAQQGRFSIFLKLIKAAKAHSFLLRYEAEKSFLQWDGKGMKKKQEVVGLIPLMFFTSRDLELAYAAPEKRRLFFDELLSVMKPSYQALLLGYRKLLLNRNRELRLGRRHTVWDEALIEKAALIVKARQAFLRIITPLFKVLLTVFFPKNYFNAHAALPSFTYCIKKGERFLAGVSHFDYQQHFKAQLNEDVKRGFTTFGPQTDDYHFFFNAQPLAHSASQGEMRLFLYALKFTLYEYFKKTSRMSPVLLLDDVLTDFDEEKTTRFLSYLKKQKQALLTLANETLAAATVKPAALFRLSRSTTASAITPACGFAVSSLRNSTVKEH